MKAARSCTIGCTLSVELHVRAAEQASYGLAAHAYYHFFVSFVPLRASWFPFFSFCVYILAPLRRDSPFLISQADQPAPQGAPHGVGAIGGAEFAANRRHVELHGLI